jgi:epoxyqueuosine reductase QueG
MGLLHGIMMQTHFFPGGERMKDRVKEILMDLGADICGIAAADSFRDAPKGFHPRDIFAGCKSVAVFALALPRTLYEGDTRIVYNHFNELNAVEIDSITLKACKKIEALGAKCMPVPCDGPYDHWEPERLRGQGILSMKHAAVLAGIGCMGKNTLLMNRRFGNRMNLGALLTDIEMESDPPAENICIPGCSKCMDACPVKALDGITARQDLCRPHTYGVNERGFSVCNCNRCRTVCPRALGLDK